MKYLIIALLCMLIVAYSVELIDRHLNPIRTRNEKRVTVGLGALLGLACSIPVMLINGAI